MKPRRIQERKNASSQPKPTILTKPLRFCGLFLLILVLALGAYLFVLAKWPQAADAFLSGLMSSVAQAVSFFLNILGFESQVNGRTIMTDKLALEIIVECTGFYESLILVAAVLAYPARLTRKLLGVLIFLVLIYLINLFRMVSLSLIGQYSMSLFELVHLYVLRISSLLIIVLLWMLWILKAGASEK